MINIFSIHDKSLKLMRNISEYTPDINKKLTVA